MAYTAVPTVTTGELWTAANQNTYLRDNATSFANRFVPVTGGYNQTDTSDINPSWAGVVLPDSKLAFSVGFFRAIASNPVANVIVRSQGTGNVYGNFAYGGGNDDEAYNTHNGSTGYETQAVTADDNDFVHSLTCTDVTNGDVVLLQWSRDATHANDTANADVYVTGYFITY